jgi:prepilin-type N-terminal cleavage/methylation domain-containing protein
MLNNAHCRRDGNRNPGRRSGHAGFTLLEVIVAMAILGMIVLAVYGAITSGMTSLRMARENLRATQILVEKTEVLRLYNWDQLNTNFLPAKFVTNYDVNSSSTNSGVLYYGTITLAQPNIGTTYTNDLRLVTVRVNWKTGPIQRTRELSTYVCRTGIQNYVY